MFGLGAGWANVPALNLLMGAPLKLAVGTSGLVLSIIDTSAAWVYLNRGAVLPMLVAPSIIGVMLGAKIGVRLLRRAPARVVRRVVLALLLVAGGIAGAAEGARACGADLRALARLGRRAQACAVLAAAFLAYAAGLAAPLIPPAGAARPLEPALGALPRRRAGAPTGWHWVAAATKAITRTFSASRSSVS